jgi:hypothetical protein
MVLKKLKHGMSKGVQFLLGLVAVHGRRARVQRKEPEEELIPFIYHVPIVGNLAVPFTNNYNVRGRKGIRLLWELLLEDD